MYGGNIIAHISVDKLYVQNYLTQIIFQPTRWNTGRAWCLARGDFVPEPGETAGRRDIVGVCSGYFHSSSIRIPFRNAGYRVAHVIALPRLFPATIASRSLQRPRARERYRNYGVVRWFVLFRAADNFSFFVWCIFRRISWEEWPLVLHLWVPACLWAENLEPSAECKLPSQDWGVRTRLILWAWEIEDRSEVGSR